MYVLSQLRDLLSRTCGQTFSLVSEHGPEIEQFVTLHREIDACEVCRAVGLGITKAAGIVRGNGRALVMAVGIAPGRAAMTRGKAFAGGSFSRLRSWFAQAGFEMSEDALRGSIYLTSLIKCSAEPDEAAQRLALWRNCHRFLWRQIELVQPSLVLLLGAEPLSVLTDDRVGPISKVVGSTWTTLELFGPELIPRAPEQVVWMALPHPSGLSRLMNDPGICARVVASLHTSLVRIGFGESGAQQ